MSKEMSKSLEMVRDESLPVDDRITILRDVICDHLDEQGILYDLNEVPWNGDGVRIEPKGDAIASGMVEIDIEPHTMSTGWHTRPTGKVNVQLRGRAVARRTNYYGHKPGQAKAMLKRIDQAIADGINRTAQARERANARAIADEVIQDALEGSTALSALLTGARGKIVVGNHYNTPARVEVRNNAGQIEIGVSIKLDATNDLEHEIARYILKTLAKGEITIE